MAFVKLDCGILDSTLWPDRDAREVFITALLMATPRELTEPMETLEVGSLTRAEFVVPPGWYGFVAASGTGIIHRAGLTLKEGILALERLGQPEYDSRTPDHEGRRLVRVDGGYIALNYDKYRQKDHTAAERSRRYRERKLPARSTPTPFKKENPIKPVKSGTPMPGEKAYEEAVARGDEEGADRIVENHAPQPKPLRERV